MAKKNLARAAHFVVHFFAVVLHDFNENLPSAGFMEEVSHVLLFALFFFTAAHFQIGGRYHFSFSHHRYKNFYVFLPTKFISFIILSLALSLSLVSTSV